MVAMRSSEECARMAHCTENEVGSGSVGVRMVVGAVAEDEASAVGASDDAEDSEAGEEDNVEVEKEDANDDDEDKDGDEDDADDSDSGAADSTQPNSRTSIARKVASMVSGLE
jgi:hypothetical protein